MGLSRGGVFKQGIQIGDVTCNVCVPSNGRAHTHVGNGGEGQHVPAAASNTEGVRTSQNEGDDLLSTVSVFGLREKLRTVFESKLV